MEIKEITYSRGETRQLKPYEPTNIHLSIKAEVKDGENLNQAYATLQKIVDDEIAIKLAILDEKVAGKIVREAAKQVVQDDPF